ncbi:MAG: alpha/beta hydrolase [Pseudomonadales bacterium]|nr:alpha/beta hydrolase [Pseudomonadales bacterium]MDP7359051.1 alpha/beta hydrolase [Pseudomonadales bacterium]HJN52154.1 alpha/beta hydrolase [Pseudomonadales bacterium]
MDLDQLRRDLEPFSFDGPIEHSDPTRSYFRYYGIDFEDRIDVQHRFGCLPDCDFNIALHYFQPDSPRGTVFVMHGYFDHVGIYAHLIEYFLTRNYAVVSYDQPGHGLSGGQRTSIDSFDQYVEVLTHCLSSCDDHCARPWHIVGQSLAGAIIMTHLLRNRYSSASCPFDQIVVLAPLVHPSGWRMGKWMHAVGKYFFRQRKRTFNINSHDDAFLEFLRNRDSLQSTILPMHWVTALKVWIREFHSLPTSSLSITVIQGTDDHTVDWRYNMKVVREKFPNLTIHYLTDGRHQLVNESESLRSNMFDLMDSLF